MTLFLVIHQVFLILCIFIVSNVLSNVVYDPFFTTKNPLSKKNSLTTPIFYSVQTFAPIPQHYFSKYSWDQCMGRPPLQILGGPSPQSHRSPPLEASADRSR